MDGPTSGVVESLPPVKEAMLSDVSPSIATEEARKDVTLHLSAIQALRHGGLDALSFLFSTNGQWPTTQILSTSVKDRNRYASMSSRNSHNRVVQMADYMEEIKKGALEEAKIFRSNDTENSGKAVERKETQAKNIQKN